MRRKKSIRAVILLLLGSMALILCFVVGKMIGGHGEGAATDGNSATWQAATLPVIGGAGARMPQAVHAVAATENNGPGDGAVGGGSKPIHFVAEVQGGAEMALKSAARLRLPQVNLDPSTTTISAPLGDYAYQAGHGLEGATDRGTVVYGVGSQGATVELARISNTGGAARMISLGGVGGPDPIAAVEKLQMAKEVQGGTFEARMLTVQPVGSNPNLRFNVLWLKAQGEGTDLIYTLQTQRFNPPAGINAETLYTAKEFFKVYDPK